MNLLGLLLDLLASPKSCVLRVVLMGVFMGVFYLVVYLQQLLYKVLRIDVKLEVLLIVSAVFMALIYLWWRWRGYAFWKEVITPSLEKYLLKSEDDNPRVPGVSKVNGVRRSADEPDNQKNLPLHFPHGR